LLHSAVGTDGRACRRVSRCPGEGDREARVGSVIKKRRKKMRKHKHKKMLKKTRWQRRAS
jgi:hypothetical protein